MFKNVGDLAQMGFVDREDFKILSNNKWLTESEDKWLLVIHENIIDKVKVKR